MFSSVGIIWASVRLVDAASVAAESLVLQAEHARHATTPHVLIAVLTACQQTPIQDTVDIIRNKSQVSRKIKYKDHIKNSYQRQPIRTLSTFRSLSVMKVSLERLK